MEERLVAALEALAGQQRVAQNPFVLTLKEIAHVKEFDGDKKQLTQFLQVVDALMTGQDQQRKAELWQAIYNTKITGKAKELLLHNETARWEDAIHLLKQHFRPTCNHREITRKIGNLKVSSVQDLCYKIENILADINILATYEVNSVQVKQMLYHTLISKIKHISIGNLSRK